MASSKKIIYLVWHEDPDCRMNTIVEIHSGELAARRSAMDGPNSYLGGLKVQPWDLLESPFLDVELLGKNVEEA